MKQEFVTLYGRAIIERSVLHFRNPFLPFGKTGFAIVGFELLFLAIVPFRILTANKPMDYVGAAAWTILVLFRLPDSHDVLFKRSYSNRIPLNKIVSATVLDDDPHGLHTTVKLFLRSGRYKKIVFRTRENQHEAFVNSLALSPTGALA